jgi:hypothetical protein
MVELRGNVARGLETARALRIKGFTLDTTYGAISMGPQTRDANDPEDMTFVVRGEVEEGAREKLAAHPNVVAV